MNPSSRPSFALPGFGALLLFLCAGAGPLRAQSDWKEISQTPTLTIYQRDHPGSSYKEVKAIGTFDQPNWVIKNVLDDTNNYADFMPYVKESRVISRDKPTKGTLVAYALVSPPMISDRDYTIMVHDESKTTDQGVVYKTHWEPANDKGPAEKKGVVRVNVNQGSWLLEPTDNGQHTRGTYTLYTDGGGGVLAMVVNSLNKRRMNELFETIEKQSQQPRYHQNKPSIP